MPLPLAPLPSWFRPRPKGGNVTIVAEVPHVAPWYRFRWSDVEERLPLYKEAGADTLALWPIWDYPRPRVKRITVKTAKGEVSLWITTWGWAPTDYRKLNPDKGSERDFLRLVRRAHELGLKVVPVFQVSYSFQGGFIYEKHPEWILRSIYGGFAIIWPWRGFEWGFVVNKSHSGLVRFVTEEVLPHWVEVWEVDGFWLDSPPMFYCDPRVYKICRRVGCVEGAEPLTPVEGFYTTEPLARALREKVEELKEKTGRDLVCAAEAPGASWSDWPDEYIEAICRGKRLEHFWWKAINDPRIKDPCGKYWDWFCDYRFRTILWGVYKGARECALSRNYVNLLRMEPLLPGRGSERARFVNMLNHFGIHRPLHHPERAECFLVLAATAPGRVLWIGCGQVDELPEAKFLRPWYGRLALLKRSLPSLQSRNIEDALVEPEVPGLIAYNRWEGEEAVTVVVNASGEKRTARLRPKFGRAGRKAWDLLHGGPFECDPKGTMVVALPPWTARILAPSA